MTTSPDVSEVVPFLRVTDMRASIRFYVDGVGGEITVRWEPQGELRWCRLELGAAALMLQTFAPGARGAAPLGAGVSLAFTCGDAVALYRSMRARGLAPSEPFVGNGLWVTTVSDPDGYRLEFASPADVAEDTKLSDVP